MQPPSPSPDNTAAAATAATVSVILLAVAGVVLVSCVGLALIVVVCLAAIQVLGTNANSAFGTVGASIGATVGAPNGQAESVARQFLDDLGANQVDRAYGHLSMLQQRAVSLGEFRADVMGWPGLTRQKSYRLTANPDPFDPNFVRFTAMVEGQDAVSYQVTLKMIRENGQWKVDEINVIDILGDGKGK